jgi:hypothetical protein
MVRKRYYTTKISEATLNRPIKYEPIWARILSVGSVFRVTVTVLPIDMAQLVEHNPIFDDRWSVIGD